MKNLLHKYFCSWWIPILTNLILALLWILFTMPMIRIFPELREFIGLAISISFFGVLVAALVNLFKKRFLFGCINLIYFLVIFGFFFLMARAVATAFVGPSEDGFADELTIPEGIEINDPLTQMPPFEEGTSLSDEYQHRIRDALKDRNWEDNKVTPSLPSLRKAADSHAETFLAYLEASPHWHIFQERGNRFASRRWIYKGEPRDELHGYISEFGQGPRFQTRCLLCLDQEQWSSYWVQKIQESSNPVRLDMSKGNELHESRVMIEAGQVWIEIFEQSDHPERRITKATLLSLEEEFSAFVENPDEALRSAKEASKDLAKRRATRIGEGMSLVGSSGMYSAIFSLNPGEAGKIYLKAFEITKGTPLSSHRLKGSSTTRMSWSDDSSELFGAKVGFMIYEGDWGQHYAARFEVWFAPDSGGAERKLLEKNFKIEGWQR